MRKRLGVTALAAAIVAGVALLPTDLRGSDPLRVWGMSTDGQTCTGTCGPNNICCKITPVPPPISPSTPG
jgi:hypothetical protein